MLEGDYNILTDPQLEAKGVADLLKRAFAGESVKLPAICYDPAEMNMPGTPRWVKAAAHPILDVDGRVSEVMLVHEDVTEQVHAEKALRDSEKRLQLLANTIPQMAWMAHSDGAAFWFNDRWYAYTAALPKQLEGRGWEEFLHPEAHRQVADQWRTSLATSQPFEMTFPLRGKDGAYRPFYTLAAPLKDGTGEVQCWFGTNTDVSAFETAQQALHVAEERLRVATEAGDIGVWEWDLGDNSIYWSERVYRLHGVDPAGLTVDVQTLASMIEPTDWEILWQKVDNAIRHGGGYTAEFRAVLPDGGRRWLSTWARVESCRDGRAKRLIGATISIDAYKKSQEALQENSRRKDEFLAMLAHELRNPLAPVLTAAQLLKVAGSDTLRVHQASDIIERQVRHLTTLVDDLLDASRVTRGLVQLSRAYLDLRVVVRQAIEQAQPLLDVRNHTLNTRMASGQIVVHGDRTRLVQVIVNLLNNATKYTPPGGEITLSVEICGPRVKITVTDNGIGIEAELLPHVFELFTQAKRTPDRSQGGLGIGLALVRSVIEMHAGCVYAESPGSGKGSTFAIELPLVTDVLPVPAEQAEQGAAQRDLRALQITLVDDNSDATDVLAALLQTQGHTVVVHNDATRALAGAAARPSDVYILDIGLPEMDGYELVKRLRAMAETGKAIYIALSGYGQAQDKEHALRAGFHYHLVKPVRIEVLQPLLAGLVAKVPQSTDARDFPAPA